MMARAKFDTLDAPWSAMVRTITRWDVAVPRFEAVPGTGPAPSWSVPVIPIERVERRHLAARSPERPWAPKPAGRLHIPCSGARGRQCCAGPRHEPRGGDGEPAQGVDGARSRGRIAPGGPLRSGARGARRRTGAPRGRLTAEGHGYRGAGPVPAATGRRTPRRDTGHDDGAAPLSPGHHRPRHPPRATAAAVQLPAAPAPTDQLWHRVQAGGRGRGPLPAGHSAHG